MKDQSKGSGCFKYGCIGCLTISALLVGITLLIAAIQVSMEGESRPEQREAVHDLPAPPPIAAPLYPTTDLPGGSQELILPGDVAPPDLRPGRLELDLTMGRFTLRPGPAGEPIRVEADYDSGSSELVEEYTENDDGSWIYEVRFGGRGGILGMLLRGGEGNRNRVDIVIPRGQPVEIVGRIGRGESEADLGGLWLSKVDLEYTMGEHFLEFREALPFPMESFHVESSMGQLEIRSLGEASPREVFVKHSMGEILVDLEGPWRRDAEVDLDFGMGSCRVWVPDDVHVDLDSARVALGEKSVDLRQRDDLPADAPTLTLHVSGAMGEIRIED